MKIKLTFALVALALVVGLPHASAQGYSFTYQGRLSIGGVPYTGNATIQPTLWDAPTNGTLIAGNSPTGSVVAVTNGLFLLTLNFGDHFPGADRWLELDVTTNGLPFTALAPRQQLTPTPYAMTASGFTGFLLGDVNGTQSATVVSSVGGQPAAAVAGGVNAANSATSANTPSTVVKRDASGNFSAAAISAASISGNGGGLTNVNASALGGFTPANFWQLGGNSVAGGQFLGSTNNQPVEIWVNNSRAFRLEPNTNAPNFIVGSSNNFMLGSYGSCIGGGGADAAYYLGPATNSIYYGEFSVIAGGDGNSIRTNAPHSFIGGGTANLINNYQRYTAIAGGADNQIGGFTRVAVGFIPGDGNFIGGGGGSWISDGVTAGAIGGGINHSIGSGAAYSFIGGGNFNIIFGGATNATISGGAGNWIQTNAYGSSIAGGEYNQIQASAQRATIAGGLSNTVAGAYGFAAGRRAKANHPGAFVWADSQDADFSSTANNEFLVRAGGGVGINVNDPAGAALTVNGGVKVLAGNTLEFGAGVAGKEVNAGKIGYAAFTVGSLDIVGAGTSTSNRKIQFYCEGGANFTGPISSPSDRNLKQDFRSLDARAVLAKVAALPIQSWAYKYDATKRHIGPVAQDFQTAFGLNGGDDKSITTVDADGVALAAIQGLNQELEAQRAELQTRERRITELESRLARLERLLPAEQTR